MENIIKYVKNVAGDGPGGGSGETPYLNLEDTISVNRYSSQAAAGEETVNNYSTLAQNDPAASSSTPVRKDDDSGMKHFFVLFSRYIIFREEKIMKIKF